MLSKIGPLCLVTLVILILSFALTTLMFRAVVVGDVDSKTNHLNSEEIVMSAFSPEGPWGSYGKPPIPFSPFAWAKVNPDGTFVDSSGNLKMIKGSTGNYILVPLDAQGNELTYAPTGLLADVEVSGGIPFLGSPTFGSGPNSNGFLVVIYNVSVSPAVVADEAFYFKLFTTGKI